jgi:methyl-accepting chemotaxis protein
MKLGFKLLAAPLLTAVVVIAVGQINGYLQNVQAEKGLTSSQDSLDLFKTMGNVQLQMAEVHAGVYRTVALIDSLDQAKVKAVRADFGTQLAGVKRVVESIANDAEMDANIQGDVKAAAELVGTYTKQADAAINFAQLDANTGVAAMQRAELTFKQLNKAAGEITAKIESSSHQTIMQSRSQGRSISWTLALVSLVVGSLAVLVAWRMQDKIVTELAHAVVLTNEVAHGNLAVNAATERDDEVGDLLRAMATMVYQLNQSIATVRESSESIRQASAEIAHGNQDLSLRTEQTATNLQRASGSTEQLNTTVHQSAESARQAFELASNASLVAARGGAVVGQVVSTMEEINVSARKISDIIGVIDGIAFQTNILALNAAVEAARAGEQGRGFAVVASEVRSLAGRSAEAAKEIKHLIGVSVAKVDSGSRLVASAGETMQEIVDSVQRVSDMIGQISATANEQSQGISHVNLAVAELDQMTQQNAALVEESAAAAESLREQAQRLAQVVSTFNLSTKSVVNLALR